MKSKWAVIGLTGVILVSSSIVGYGIKVKAASHPTKSKQVMVTNEKILALLPKNAHLISNPSEKAIQRIDMNHDGKKEYAVLYQFEYQGARHVGAMIIREMGGKLKKLWQYTGPELVMPASLTVKDMLNNGKYEVIFQAEAGAMANYYDVLSWYHGHIKSIFHSFSARLDVGNYDGKGSKDIATWTLDTGLLYNIQMYGWSGNKHEYQLIPNADMPIYFRSDVVPYYQKAAHSIEGRSNPKMVAYGLANAYFDAGEYSQSLKVINKGLKLKINDYPSNSKFIALKNLIEKSTAAPMEVEAIPGSMLSRQYWPLKGAHPQNVGTPMSEVNYNSNGLTIGNVHWTWPASDTNPKHYVVVPTTIQGKPYLVWCHLASEIKIGKPENGPSGYAPNQLDPSGPSQMWMTPWTNKGGSLNQNAKLITNDIPPVWAIGR